MAAAHRALIGHMRGVALVAPWLLYLFLADVVLSLMLPFKRLAPRIVYDLSSIIAGSVWRWIQSIFVRLNGAEIICSGDELPTGESAIVVSNHVAWSDFFMIQALAKRAGMLGRCRYYAKVQLRLVPFLGWGLWAMGMPMVSRNWLKDKSELNRVFTNIVTGGFPTWLISFSEATRFNKKKYQESQLWCEARDRPHPLHLLYPRTKGFIATVQHLRKAPHIKAIYDLAILYRRGSNFQEAPSIWDALSIPKMTKEAGFQFYVHTRRFPIASLPEKDEELAKWLEQIWATAGPVCVCPPRRLSLKDNSAVFSRQQSLDDKRIEPFLSQQTRLPLSSPPPRPLPYARIRPLRRQSSHFTILNTCPRLQETLRAYAGDNSVMYSSLAGL
ncbi:1-acyl-sn-glycerol-3-phosphate acyltransferase 3 [Cladobotryum mycophilum]|uniref:1-acyl-sn-glycerol-3-phosphate acyltransferase 3 n=1 Tax=Cladobotryum mycophilum TaxID=491253 RepID=A0ABR0S7K7_9HYPO